MKISKLNYLKLNYWIIEFQSCTSFASCQHVIFRGSAYSFWSSAILCLHSILFEDDLGEIFQPIFVLSALILLAGIGIRYYSFLWYLYQYEFL